MKKGMKLILGLTALHALKAGFGLTVMQIMRLLQSKAQDMFGNVPAWHKTSEKPTMQGKSTGFYARKNGLNWIYIPLNHPDEMQKASKWIAHMDASQKEKALREGLRFFFFSLVSPHRKDKPVKQVDDVMNEDVTSGE